MAVDEINKNIVEPETVESVVAVYPNDLEKEKQHQQDLQRIRGLRLIDDDFMNACFDGYIEGTELLLRIILNKQDIHVRSGSHV